MHQVKALFGTMLCFRTTNHYQSYQVLFLFGQSWWSNVLNTSISWVVFNHFKEHIICFVCGICVYLQYFNTWFLSCTSEVIFAIMEFFLSSNTAYNLSKVSHRSLFALRALACKYMAREVKQGLQYSGRSID